MSEAEEEKPEGFKIEDKRRFTATGQARDDGPEEPAAEDGPADVAELSPEPPDDRQDESLREADDADAPAELTFSSFVVGLASQAFMFLGMAPDPQSGVVHTDLAQARAMIDVLAMIRDKTHGNLDEDEDRLMEEMLYELQMQYVREARGAMPTEGDN